jgi:histidinol-phosphate/aromatic aminotransferase/cobyric acid decarboxylase-like protein
VRRFDSADQSIAPPLERLASMSLQELRRYAEHHAAETEGAMARYTELRRSPLGASSGATEAAHAAWQAQYRHHDQVAALIQKRERDSSS